MINILELIEDALAECKRYRAERNALNLGLQYPMSPRAWSETFYLTLREDVIRACATTVKSVENPLFRTQVYQILVQALTDIFQYGYSWAIVKPYYKLIVQVLLTYCLKSLVQGIPSVTSVPIKSLVVTLASLYAVGVFRIELVASPASVIAFFGVLGVKDVVASPSSVSVVITLANPSMVVSPSSVYSLSVS